MREGGTGAGIVALVEQNSVHMNLFFIISLGLFFKIHHGSPDLFRAHLGVYPSLIVQT